MSAAFCLNWSFKARNDMLLAAKTPNFKLITFNSFEAMWERIPKFFRSFYFLVTAAFLTWMFFFDENDFIRQYQMSKKLSDLEEERDYYVSKIQEVEKDRHELMSNADLLEKFAREKYLMKRPTEDVFLIIPEEKRQEEIEAQQVIP